jgi:hypothetical protein
MEHRDPLGMSLMAHNLNRRRWSGWGLVPGPVDFDEPSFSYDMQDPIAEYRASMVAEVALSIPGVERTHVEMPSWWDWRARWTGGGGSYIDLEMTLFDDEVDPPSFGGFLVDADCTPSQLLALWLALRREFPQVWLHSPACRFYKPGSFRTELAADAG